MREPFVSLLGAALGVILVNNFIFSQLLGVDPFLKGSRSLRAAGRMGLSVTLIMGLVSAVCWPLNEYILVPWGLRYMQSFMFLMVTAFLVGLLEILFQKLAPALRTGWGTALTLTANCGVLGVVLQNVQGGNDFVQSVVCGLAGGLSFLLAILLFASLRERVEFAECPKAFEGVPIALVTAGLLALCFTGFSSLSIFG